MARPSFANACARYVHRYTMDHIPAWAHQCRGCSTWYAPHFASDAEWYANTVFPGEKAYPLGRNDTSCYTTNATFPLGYNLDEPPRLAIARHRRRSA